MKTKKEKENKKRKRKQIKRTQDILNFTVVKVMVEQVVNVLVLLKMVILVLEQN